MALCPFAKWDRLPGSEPSIHPRMVIFHTMVGYLTSTDRYFRSGASGGIESHFGVGGKWGGDATAGLDGAIWQWRNTTEQADANLDANDFAISIETADNAPASASDLQPWTPKQVVSLIRLGRWLAETHDIPKRIVTSWDDPRGGFGWHAMWGAPSHWTPSAGKVCPGAARIKQLKEVVLPAIFSGEDVIRPMAFYDTEADFKAAVLAAVRQGLITWAGTWEPDAGSPMSVLTDARNKTNAVLASVGALSDDEAKILAAISGISSGTADVQAIVTALRSTLPQDVVSALKEAL